MRLIEVVHAWWVWSNVDAEERRVFGSCSLRIPMMPHVSDTPRAPYGHCSVITTCASMRTRSWVTKVPEAFSAIAEMFLGHFYTI